MNKRKHRVNLDREPSIRRCNEQSLGGDAPELAKESSLVGMTSDVFDDGAGVNEIVTPITEWKIAPVGADEANAGVRRLNEGGVLDADRGDAALVRIPRFKIVRMIMAAVVGDPDVKYSVACARTHRLKECREHPAPLLFGDFGRQGAGRGQAPDSSAMVTHLRLSLFWCLLELNYFHGRDICAPQRFPCMTCS